MWGLSRKGDSGFSSSSTALQVTQGIHATALTAIVTGRSFSLSHCFSFSIQHSSFFSYHYMLSKEKGKQIIIIL